ncbi:hypothetical protein ACLKM7_04700 [Microbacterium sp. I2]|uniref:hypothetical protein n=1 Tax=Microbacterium sp. I2 TaxID=3391826 RepID=UPI003EDA867A
MNDDALDLLALIERPPPLGGMGFRNRAGRTQSIWRDADPGTGIVGRRIVHARTMQLAGPAQLRRLGVRPGRGYHKCGSDDQWDWVRAFRLTAHAGGQWQTVLDIREMPTPSGSYAPPLWYDLGGLSASAAIIEVLQCGLDDQWTPWNLADDAFELIGARPPVPTQRERRLANRGVTLQLLPSGVHAEERPGEVRYRTAGYEVGFALGRAGFSYLALDDEAAGSTMRDLLHRAPGIDLQGIMLHPVGGSSLVGPALRCDVEGHVRVEGNRVRYEVSVPGAAQRFTLDWRMYADRIELVAEREGERSIEAWESAAWQIAFDPRTAATATLGRPRKEGRTGLLELPVLLHAPGHGSIRVIGHGATATWRSDADRPNSWLTGELKLGETPTDRGTTILEPGSHRCAVTWLMAGHGIEADQSAPAPVARAMRRAAITGLSYRADTGTLSNNSISIHCPMSMDTWSALATSYGEVMPGLDAVELLRDSLERWLDGGPGYGSGTMRDRSQLRPAEDEYLISGVGTMLGLGEYLDHSRNSVWLRRYSGRIKQKLEQLAARDLDGDGLIESPHRRGVSGDHDWSTNWYDVVSFGWKDAYVNALLFRALTLLGEVLPELGAPELAVGIAAWCAKLRDAFGPTFLNPDTGWIAGWRSADGRLHDYAFLAVNGAVANSGVLSADASRQIIGALWEEYRRVGEPDARLGLPNNLWPIPDEDLTEPMQGFPHGFYLNGALSHSQARHFVEALSRVGMMPEAERLLGALCETLADGTAFGGSQTGGDWRYWDGAQCGYEGLLTEQFGVMALAIERHRLRG